MEIFQPITASEINDCFPVMHELRPHLALAEFVHQVRRQETQGYRMVAVRTGEGIVASVAGYRFTEFLIWGKFIYIDDLVTASSQRGKGHAGALLSWIIARARELGYNNVQLDSGFSLHSAHRLYQAKGFHLACHHFKYDITPPAPGHFS